MLHECRLCCPFSQLLIRRQIRSQFIRRQYFNDLKPKAKVIDHGSFSIWCSKLRSGLLLSIGDGHLLRTNKIKSVFIFIISYCFLNLHNLCAINDCNCWKKLGHLTCKSGCKAEVTTLWNSINKTIRWPCINCRKRQNF